MRSLYFFAAVLMVGSAANTYAQEPKTPPAKGEVTKATYMVTGLHCPPCAATVEGSLKKTKGIDAVKVDYQGEHATVTFEENLISAQEVARAMSLTPHMMGRNMQYGGILVLGVAGVDNEATAKKAAAVLSKVEGVAKVTPFPKQQAVGIQFSGKGTVTTKQLLNALETAGLKGTQYMTSAAGAAVDRAMNDSMPNHAGTNMGNGAMAGDMAMGDMAMGCSMCMQMSGMAMGPMSAKSASSAGRGGVSRGGCCR